MSPHLVFLDTETTGLDPLTDELIDVHTLLVDAGTLGVIEEAGGRLRFSGRCSPEAQAVNGYTPEVWEREARAPVDVLPSVCALIARAGAWVGSNPGFDVRFVLVACERIGLLAVIPPRFVDTAALASRAGVPKGQRGLDALVARYGLPAGDAHTARGDCYRALEVYRRLAGRAVEVTS